MAYDIVIDTNVIIAAMRSKQGASNLLLRLLGTSTWKAHISIPLIFEYEEVCYRSLSSFGLSHEQINDFLDYLCTVCSHHKIFYLWRPYLKDADDDFLLDLADEASADFIVTFNKKDFVGIGKFAIEALTPKEFLQKTGDLS
jgi:putative PIN family toxin of toxin-antitoxin system